MYSRTKKSIEVEESIDLSQFGLFDELILDSEEYLLRVLKRGDNINALNKNNYTPLMNAAGRGKVVAVALFIEAGANLDCQTHFGLTALHLAFREVTLGKEDISYRTNPYFSIISMLYVAGAKPLLNQDENTPLMSLSGCNTGALEFCLQEFSEHESKYYFYKKEYYDKAIRTVYKQREMNLHRFIDFRLIDYTRSKNTPSKPLRNPKNEFLIALQTNNIAQVRILLDSCPELDVNGFYNGWQLRPISIVIYSNQHPQYDQQDCRPLLALLIKRGADVNLKNNSPIILNNNTALEECATYQAIDIDLMLFLIESGAKTDFNNYVYRTLIRKASDHCVVGNNQLALEWLLHYCDDINRQAIIASIHSFGSTVSRRILDKFMLDPNNAIEVALNNMASIDNANLILYSFRYKIYFHAHHSGQHISFVNLFNSLFENESFSPFAKNKLTYLLKLQNKSDISAPSCVDPIEFYHFSKLLESLYEAVLDINKAVSSAASGFKDTGALQSLGLWRRKQNPNPVIAAVAQRELDRVGGLVVYKRQ